MLEIRNLEKSFGDKQVLFGVDLTAQQGHILGLVGKSDYARNLQRNWLFAGRA